MKTLGLLLLVSCMGFASPQRQQTSAADETSTITAPSLGELARVAREQRANKDLKDVPLYTNDNLPVGNEGISVLGPTGGGAAEPTSAASSARINLLNEQKMSYLRGKLSRLQEEQQLHQRELVVLQQQISQTKMEWSPNPNETLRQEYSRQNVNELAGEIDRKKEQIAEGQQEIQAAQDQLERAEARYGWLSAAAPAGRASVSESEVPPGIAPGSQEYWQARIQAAKQELATAKERLSLAKRELSLLKLQQLRSLDPNVQASLASSIPQKQDEITSDAQAVAQAEQTLKKVQAEAQSAAAHK